MKEIMFPIFFSLVGAVVLSWLAMVIELVSVAVFSPLAFRLGPIVLRGRFRIPTPTGDTLSIGSHGGKVKRDKNGVLLFRPRFGIFSFNTPFPIKGTLRPCEPGEMSLEGRLPLSSVVFVVFWIFASVSLAVLLTSMGEARAGFSFLGAGIVVVVLMFLISWSIEVGRAKDTVRSLQKLRNSRNDK